MSQIDFVVDIYQDTVAFLPRKLTQNLKKSELKFSDGLAKHGVTSLIK